MFRSGKHIYAQVIDDAQGRTLAAASSLDKTLREALRTGADKAAAAAVGKLVAERALAAGRRRRWCSTAALICTTAASRRWPTPPARAGWRSEEESDHSMAREPREGGAARAATASARIATR